jgi:D-aspartate ligase
MSNPPAILLGGTVTALSVARSLTDAGVEVHVLDHRNSPVRRSRLRHTFVELDAAHMQPGMLEWLRSNPREAVLLACGDEGLELIARHRPELLELGLRPMEADDEVLLAMLDKRRTDELAREHGIAVPRVLPLRGPADIEAVSREFGYPCVLKPVHSHIFVRRTGSRAKVVAVDSEAALRTEFDRLHGLGVEMLVIEVITGPDDEFVSYYSYLDEAGRPLLHFTKRKLRQYPTYFGSGTYHQTTRDPEVAEVGLRFLEAVGLRGLGNVEFKRDGNDGRLKLIECNARFTMSNELIRIAGVDLALFSYNRVLGRPTPAVDSYRAGVRLWDPVHDALAFVQYRRSGELTLAGWVTSLLHRQHLRAARIDDPIPAALGLARLLEKATVGRLRPAPAARPRRAALGRGLSALAERTLAAGGSRSPIASRLELAATVGPGYAIRRLRAHRRFSGLGEPARYEAYARIWGEAAEATGARIEELAKGLFEISKDDVRARVFQQMVDIEDPVTLKVALDKTLVHRMVTAAGLRVPEHLEFDVLDPAPAIEFLERAAGPCVVKPAAGSGGGHGTTAGVETVEELMRARRNAATNTRRLLIERQATGAVYRLLLLEGELLDVVRSVPGHLVGDGVSTVQQLILAENERRAAARGAAGLALLGANLDMLLCLEHAGLSLSSVAPAGRTIAIGAVTNNNASEDNETFRGDLSPELVADARRAQEVVGVRLAGVDVITPDPARRLEETGGVINEVNGTPGLHHHYLVADPASATRVAIPVLERLLNRAPVDGRADGDGRAPSRVAWRGSA